MFAAQSVTSLLYERDARGTGTGGVIDVYMYGSILCIVPSPAGRDALHSHGAPRVGEHTDEVLSSVLGLSSTDLDTLRADRII